VTRATASGVSVEWECLLAVSPHLDDAVFGAGELLATSDAAVVVTVFAGLPQQAHASEWDGKSGFRSGEEAVAARRREDQAALAILQCVPRWQPFLDSQYGASPTIEQVVESLRDELCRQTYHVVAMPLGLFHSDHRLVHQACRVLMEELDGASWIAYEDALYRRMPGLLQERLADLHGAGVRATPLTVAHPPDTTTRKARAVACYESQLRAFGPNGASDTTAPERYWMLERMTARTS
jgi:LmbE family N-acetylglucosaminyl deacetylase